MARITQRAAAPIEIFLPRLHYPHGVRVEVSDGTYEVCAAEQVLVDRHGETHENHALRVNPTGGLRASEYRLRALVNWRLMDARIGKQEGGRNGHPLPSSKW